MEFKPSDFFIGVVDLFSVILPGALITYFLKERFYDDLFVSGKVFPPLDTELQRWIAYIIAAYIIGHIVSSIGALVLDEWIYKRLRKTGFIKKNCDLSYFVATLIRDKHIPSKELINNIKTELGKGNLSKKGLDKNEVKDGLGKEKPTEVINTYKWAQHYLAIKKPETLVEVKKFEADSKFFRSLTISFIIMGCFLAQKDGWWAVGIIILALISVYRYSELRYKSTDRAYEQIITNYFIEEQKFISCQKYE